MMQAIFAAFLAFIATNVDDLVLVMIMGAEVGRDRLRRRHIWAGQFLAIGSITALGVLAALLISILPQGFEGYMRYLGALPILIGVWHIAESLLGKRKKRRSTVRQGVKVAVAQPKKTKTRVGQVFLMLFLAGADNAGVYAPMFAGMGFAAMIASVVMYLALTWVFCAAALRLAGNARLEALIQRYEAIIVPVVLILIGVVMLLDV